MHVASINGRLQQGLLLIFHAATFLKDSARVVCSNLADLFLICSEWVASIKGRLQQGSSASYNPPSLGLCKVCMLESEQSFTLRGWLLSKEGFSKGSFSLFSHPPTTRQTKQNKASFYHKTSIDGAQRANQNMAAARAARPATVPTNSRSEHCCMIRQIEN